MKRIKLICCVVSVCFAAMTAFSAAPNAPQVTVQAYANGAVNLGVWQYESTYPDKTGTSLIVNYKNSLSYEVQMKGPGETDFTSVTGSSTIYNTAGYQFYCWRLATNYVGSATFRVRATNSAGETSDWTESEALAATVRVTGTVISSNGASDSKDRPFDGNIATFVDAFANNGDDEWTGYLFDKPTRIKGVRYFARLDALAQISRWREGVFQIASDASFSDAQTVYTIPSDWSETTRMTEVLFDEPVTCTAIRHWKEKGGYEQSAEVEYIPADPPFAIEVVTDYDGIRTMNPRITWTMPSGVWSSCALERATQLSGPFTVVTETYAPSAGDTFSFVDETAKVGVPRYYRVTAVCSHPSYADAAFASDVVMQTRARRLDRSWDDEKTLLSGVTVLPDTNGVHQTHSSGLLNHANCFDGDTSTFVDQFISAGYNSMLPVIGLKFDSPAHVVGFGYICRNSGSSDRIKAARLYAANNEPELLDRVAVSGHPTESANDTTLFYKACDTVLDEGASCYFLFADSSDGAFYGNVAEVLFFGWTDEDLAAAEELSAPRTLSFSRDGAGLKVSWTTGTAVSSYRLERRERGGENWTELMTLTANTYAGTDSTVTAGAWEYRVTAIGADGSTASTAAYSYLFYPLGDGTGLSGVTVWPYQLGSASPTNCVNEAARGAEVLDFTWEPGEELAAGVTDDAALAWEGSLIVPFTGIYTLTAELGTETGAGVGVFIDNAVVLDNWRVASSASEKTVSGNATLTAGQHSIRVDYHPASGSTAAKRFALRWSGPVEDEVIPVSQFVPAETAPTARLGDLTRRPYSSAKAGQNNAAPYAPYLQVLGENDYVVSGACLALGNPLDGTFDLVTYEAPVNDAFTCQATLSRYGSTSYGGAGLILQRTDGTYLFFYVRSSYANNWYGIRYSDPTTGVAKDILAETLVDSSTYSLVNDLRLIRRGSEYSFFWRKNGTADWTLLTTWTDADGIFPNNVFAGFGVGQMSQTSASAMFRVRDFTLKSARGLMLIVR